MKMDDAQALEGRLVLEAIHGRYGYDFRQYSEESIRRRLSSAMAQTGVQHLGELLHRVLTDPVFFSRVLSCLTVKVSEMFRDPAFFAAFRQHVVPLLRTYPRIRVWHAGCASGEEVYTMAILLHEAGLHERAMIYGTDLDAQVVERAQEGVYSEAEVLRFARNYELAGGERVFSDYFTQAYRRASINEFLRKNVSFFQHDLGVDFTLGEMNVIFCRNVLLYFNPTLRVRVFELFQQSLCRGGFLCLGASEGIPESARPNFEDYEREQRIYRLRSEQ